MLIYIKIKNKIKNYWQGADKIDKIFIIFLFFSFLIRIVSLLYTHLRGWDETVYLNLGNDLSINPLLYSLKNSNWNDFIPSSDLIYGWPNIGFRAPILPYIIAFFSFLKLKFFIPVIIPIIGTLSIFLVYIFGKELFNKKTGLYAAILFSLVPINLYSNQMIWSDSLFVFFMLLTFISLWKGFEIGNKKYKILFGLFFALSLLSRYTTLWFAPVFLIFFLFKYRSLSFLKDKYLWYAIGLFFMVLIPWFIYGVIYYNNPIGGFIHGFKAANYYGGIQSWNYFFVNHWRIFSITGVLFVLSTIYLFLKKEYLNRGVYLLLIWIIFFGLMAIVMPHKEDRYILMIVPAMCLFCGLFINIIGKYKNIVFGLVFIVLLISALNAFKLDYLISRNKTNKCFSDGNKFLASQSIEKDSLIMNNQSPITHYYTGKEIVLYPEILNIDAIRSLINLKYQNNIVYIFFANYDMSMKGNLKNDLDVNYKKVFECSRDYGYSAIYRYK